MWLRHCFDSCTLANPTGNTITAGPANITLSDAGPHYYICNVGQDCQFGQKLAISFSGSPGGAPTPTTPRSTQTPPTTPSPTSGTTPTDCTPSPKAGGPTQPNSSSSGVFASFLVSLLPVAAAFIF
ncbi:blue copper protein-like [Corylus avellana]|uniref:blue copper protein-like n=1 Tax=Corylus avellana TaxID=13451 RepID=UPI00286B09D4|nr:blue copper protein-like [Corylus avellana]